MYSILDSINKFSDTISLFVFDAVIVRMKHI